MNSRLLNPFKQQAWFLLLLPLFFVLHAYTEHFNFVPARAFYLVLIYAAAGFILYGLAWLLLRETCKAGIISFLIMAYFLFFGAIKDKLQSLFTWSVLWHYGFLLPAGFVIVATIFLLLKRIRRPVAKMTLYLNVLFVVLVLVDAGRLIAKAIRLNSSPASNMPAVQLSPCDTCKKPDIFFIMVDEYSGLKALQDRFHYDNSAFENTLRSQGFHIVKESRGNYNATVLAMASLLNMDYPAFNMNKPVSEIYADGHQSASANQVIPYFISNGYRLINYSFFNFPGHPAIAPNNYLPGSTSLVAGQTLWGRILLDNPFNIKKKYGVKASQSIYSQLMNNNMLIDLTIAEAGSHSASPKFVYTHLMLPHQPFYYDSKGTLQTATTLLHPDDKKIDAQYLEYLQYSNGIITDMVRKLLTASSTPPVIILMSDHGFRNDRDTKDRELCFYTLNALYFPDKKYGSFYDGMSNVNQFRIVINKLFHQQLPLLIDSTVYIPGKMN